MHRAGARIDDIDNNMIIFKCMRLRGYLAIEMTALCPIFVPDRTYSLKLGSVQ
jgi:hypothetical protein